MMRLVVVESPTKARTIRKFLPEREYRIEASMGHVRDLPASADEIPAELKKKKWARLGVDVEHNFEPLYVVPSDKKKIVRSLQSALKDADELYIATDEDREGESIGWHLVEVLNPGIPIRRMVFHEITEEAILNALNNTRELDQRLVEAQETRRILDRLVGYTISPVLWKKIAPRLSAGRVQSVAVRLLVLREKERIAFMPANYWDLKALLAKNGALFNAVMTHLGDRRLATSRDFDETTGKLIEGAASNLLLLDETRARELAERLPGEPWRVASVEERIEKRKPYPPFITSTLQQEASRKLGLSARQAMQVAQRLYEQGLITYMRTDSTNLSQEALESCRRVVQERYGKNYLSPAPRQFKQKVRNAQEAHEAIRPAGNRMPTKEDLKLTGIDGALYDLIWKRTMATQMAEAQLRFTTVQIEVGAEGSEKAIFRASGKRVEFPGFFRAYVEGSDDPEAELEDRDAILPALQNGDALTCKKLDPLGHETKPPARYTEASLVKTLEKEGIGRPSTYASIIDTVIQRGYVRKQGQQLVPTFTAFATNNLLEQQFESLVDVGFTADMEQVLDDIAAGERRAGPYLDLFFAGNQGLEKRVDEALDRIDARDVSTLSFPKWGLHVVRVGKYGPYAEGELDGEKVSTSVPEEWAPGDIDEEQLQELLRAGNQEDEPLGIDPGSNLPVLLKKGPYGHYIQLGDDDTAGKPKRVALPKNISPAEVDLSLAVQLASLPRVLGEHPETAQPIKANIGRFGPYVQHGSTFASLTKDDDLLTVELDRAMELLALKESKSRALRSLGPHPETGDQVEILAGRYGPYVKHRKVNASLPGEAVVEEVTMEQALALLESKEKGKKSTTRAKKAAPKAKKKTTATRTKSATAKKKKPAKKS